MLSMLLLWLVLISTSLPYLIFSNNVFFSSRPGGVIMLSAGAMLEYSTCQNAVTNLITMIVCTFCYVGCYLKIRDSENGSRVLRSRSTRDIISMDAIAYQRKRSQPSAG
ncbi:unnamed protein product [Cylicocyclus nassatus]|uniref:Uncharacterized protein n=1 Tax=Cylicocyclus nassatus TaxID=53992 RepID=A0AA36M1I9_CYLNA|nr:unnamed protein product [Cylicocyclus nassatus]